MKEDKAKYKIKVKQGDMEKFMDLMGFNESNFKDEKGKESSGKDNEVIQTRRKDNKQD